MSNSVLKKIYNIQMQILELKMIIYNLVLYKDKKQALEDLKSMEKRLENLKKKFRINKKETKKRWLILKKMTI